MNLKNAIFGGSVTGISDRSGAYDGSIQAWLPIKDIVQGVVVTRDKRFVKILELLPVNFYTMSSMDKSAAIEDFAAYLKIAPANLQINVLTQPFDLDGYLKLLRGYLERETNEQCRLMLEESMDYVPQLVEREALTHRFFLSFSYDPSMKAPDHTPEAIAAVLNEKAEVARRYLDRCGVAVLEPEYADNFILELFYRTRIAQAAFGARWKPEDDRLPEADGHVDGNPLVIAVDMDLRRLERVCRDACQQGRREILVAALEGQMSGLLLDQFPRRAPVRALRINTQVLAAAFGENFSAGDPWPNEPLRWKGGLIHV